MLKSISPATEELTGSVAAGENAEVEETPVAVNVTFTQSFKKNQYHEQVKTLQTVLKNRGYYEWEINWIYSPATIEAVYHFQLKDIYLLLALNWYFSLYVQQLSSLRSY